jgi:hypothetical protein
MSASTAGGIVGGILGAVVGYFTANPGAVYQGVLLGLSIGAEEGTATALPQFACPPGMKGLLDPLLGLPFALGARDPARGAIDCLGLVLYAYREGLGLALEASQKNTRNFWR